LTASSKLVSDIALISVTRATDPGMASSSDAVGDLSLIQPRCDPTR
jgi:hypothetical protein